MDREHHLPIRADARIAREVRQRLANSPYADARCLMVKCEEGVVVLRGEVASFYHRQIAQSLARGVRGVRSVVDEIVVRDASFPEPDISDAAQTVPFAESAGG